MARGSRGQPIFADDRDRERFVQTLGEARQSAGWQVHAYGRGVEGVAGQLVSRRKGIRGAVEGCSSDHGSGPAKACTMSLF